MGVVRKNKYRTTNESIRWRRRLGNEYALYKGNYLLSIGTIKEIADHLKIKEKTVHYYKTPSYKKELQKKKEED